MPINLMKNNQRLIRYSITEGFCNIVLIGRMVGGGMFFVQRNVYITEIRELYFHPALYLYLELNTRMKARRRSAKSDQKKRKV